jgi:hypothetical protein
MDHVQLPHYHIRWSDRTTLDWECFSTSAAAEKRAKDLVRPDETYTVKAFPGADTSALRTEPSRLAESEAFFYALACVEVPSKNFRFLASRHRWQDRLCSRVVELRPQYLPRKISVAERAIARRLRNLTHTDSDEYDALRKAPANLRDIPEARVSAKKARAA